ncbi:MAG: Rrf2 family transcriptional regulator [Oscillospiraceae bacterium]|nr:Rrf2 family transcriptional regulator [Oscillospiraceae bacterium]
MHLTLEADYAVRIVNCLVNSGKRLDAKSISEKSCITIRFALKILGKLAAAGIVKSFKGTNGGYELNMQPSEIKLRTVIETVEGTYFFSRCLNPDNCCNRVSDHSCKYQKVFNEISTIVRDKLDEYTFDMFIEDKNN